MQYLYPKNLRSKASVWLWGMKDFAILCIATLISVLVIATTRITLCYGFLTIRKEDATVMSYIRYAAKYFITEQQVYRWREE